MTVTGTDHTIHMVVGTDTTHGIHPIRIGAIRLTILITRIITTIIRIITTTTHITQVRKPITTMAKGAQAAPTLIAEAVEFAHLLAKLTLAADKPPTNRQQ
jgi:hypothetical protein